MNGSQESMTAKICSFARAYHSCYADEKIYDDSLALELMGSEEFQAVGNLIAADFYHGTEKQVVGFPHEATQHAINTYICPIVLSRLEWSSRELEQFAAQIKSSVQCVICGAGMDTFAFRNQNPDIFTFEVDHPSTQRYKRRRIKVLGWEWPVNAAFVPVDFSKDDLSTELLRAGYRRDVPSFFSILGVSYYLPLSVFAGTIQKMAELSCPGSRIAFDFPVDSATDGQEEPRSKRLAEITAKLGEPMAQGYRLTELQAVLAEYGFSIRQHKTPAQIQQQYFSERADRQCAFENIHFLLAEKSKY